MVEEDADDGIYPGSRVKSWEAVQGEEALARSSGGAATSVCLVKEQKAIQRKPVVQASARPATPRTFRSNGGHSWNARQRNEAIAGSSGGAATSVSLVKEQKAVQRKPIVEESVRPTTPVRTRSDGGYSDNPAQAMFQVLLDYAMAILFIAFSCMLILAVALVGPLFLRAIGLPPIDS